MELPTDVWLLIIDIDNFDEYKTLLFINKYLCSTIKKLCERIPKQIILNYKEFNSYDRYHNFPCKKYHRIEPMTTHTNLQKYINITRNVQRKLELKITRDDILASRIAIRYFNRNTGSHLKIPILKDKIFDKSYNQISDMIEIIYCSDYRYYKMGYCSKN